MPLIPNLKHDVMKNVIDIRLIMNHRQNHGPQKRLVSRIDDLKRFRVAAYHRFHQFIVRFPLIQFPRFHAIP
jgi:hypothetical protein